MKQNISKFLLLFFFFSSIHLMMADKQIDMIMDVYQDKVDKLAKSYKSKKSKYKAEVLKKLEALKKQRMQKGDLDSANIVQKKIKRLQGERVDGLMAENSDNEMDFNATPPPPGTPPISKKEIRKYKKIKTFEDVNRALKALNPAYQENGQFEIEDGKIVEVNLNGCYIVNIAPLAGLKYVHTVHIADNLLWDISPLKSLKLYGLNISNTDIRDLDVLKGMKLHWLSMNRIKIQDISVLKKMPLGSLDMNGCIFINDLSPLGKCKELKSIILPPQAKDMDIKFLKKLKKLKFIDTEWKDKNKKTASQFWKDMRAR